MLENSLKGLLEIDGRTVLFYVTGDARVREVRHCHHGQQALPALPQPVLGSPQGDSLPLDGNLAWSTSGRLACPTLNISRVVRRSSSWFCKSSRSISTSD